MTVLAPERSTVLPLAGRHALVTGASRGIGRAIATRLHGLGASLTLVARDGAKLDAVAGELGSRAATLILDLSDTEAAQDAIAQHAERSAIDILVNNAGIAPSAPFAKLKLADWNQVMAVDLTAAMVLSQAVLPGMAERGFGRIVNIASTAGVTGYRYVAAYCAAKHGLVGLTRALALEVAAQGITVNAVCPGFTDTDIIGNAVSTIAAKSGRSVDQARSEFTKVNPQGRLIDPEEIAAMVAYLCGEDARGVTGQALVIAGGEVVS